MGSNMNKIFFLCELFHIVFLFLSVFLTDFEVRRAQLDK